jgi:hypothetical protein
VVPLFSLNLEIPFKKKRFKKQAFVLHVKYSSQRLARMSMNRVRKYKNEPWLMQYTLLKPCASDEKKAAGCVLHLSLARLKCTDGRGKYDVNVWKSRRIMGKDSFRARVCAASLQTFLSSTSLFKEMPTTDPLLRNLPLGILDNLDVLMHVTFIV